MVRAKRPKALVPLSVEDKKRRSKMLKAIIVLISMAVVPFLCFGCDEGGDDDSGYVYQPEDQMEFLSINASIPDGIYQIYECEGGAFVDYGPATKGQADLGTDFRLPASVAPGTCYMVQYAVVPGYETPAPEKGYLILGTPLEMEGEYTSSE
jgi:hypothetical protein